MQDDGTLDPRTTGHYTAVQIAVGSYDLFLDGQLVGGIVRNVSITGRPKDWRAELLDAAAAVRPYPFTADEHVFTGLDAVLAWLGVQGITTLT